MVEKSQIIEIVHSAIEDLNRHLPKEQQIAKSVDTQLFGSGGHLDSLALVHLITIVEQKIDTKLGLILTLADEKALSQNNSPFKSVGTLIDYIQSRCRQ